LWTNAADVATIAATNTLKINVITEITEIMVATRFLKPRVIVKECKGE